MTRAAINLNGPTGEVIDVTSLGRNTISSHKAGIGEYRVQGTLGMAPPPEGWGYVINPLDAGVEVRIRHVAPTLEISVSRDGVASDLQHSLTLHVAVEALPIEPLPEPVPDLLASVLRGIARCRAQADQAIAPLQDAVDLDEASELEQQHLRAWKRYRVALNRLPDQDGFPDNLQWPAAPQ
ncbi:tail fiber assembly protein [Pseudomonas soli]|uniref:tail fiber assembly protein n=1 Tax=Pseudomonas soli TaxID=1306993 RepID=UPI00345DE635